MHTIVSITLEVMRIVVPQSFVGRWTRIIDDLSDARDVQIVSDESSVIRQVILCLKQLFFQN